MENRQLNTKARSHWAAVCGAIVLMLTAGQVSKAQDARTSRAPAEEQTTQVQPVRSLAQDGGRVVIDTDLVTLNVSVTNADGLAVSGLERSDFTVFDDKVQQEIRFFNDDDAPASVAIVFDTSGSMRGEKLEQAKEALTRFIETSHDRDEYFLIGFDSRSRLLLDSTRDGGTVFRKLTYVQPQGNTALYDAVYLGVEKAMRGIYQKRVVLLISDGEDNDSRYSFGELRRRLRESDVIIYAIGTVENSVPPKGSRDGAETLKELASASGGKAFFPNSSTAMSEAFERIALELRHLYAIGYRPENFTADGKWHQLKIRVSAGQTSERLFVRSKAGYYAAGTRGGEGEFLPVKQ
jgi:Ca-activated chloride channel family protein